MSRAKVGRWGKNLAIRVPVAVAKAAHLNEGEDVEVEMRDHDIVIRRASTRQRADAMKAMEELLRMRKRNKLRGITIRELIDEGRKY
jgi:antitoxin component of MazEF toxin-antitoxin module